MNEVTPNAESDRGREQRLTLCELLGLDANQTTEVSVSWEAGPARPIARWSGIRVLTDGEVDRLGALLTRDTTPGGPA